MARVVLSLGTDSCIVGSAPLPLSSTVLHNQAHCISTSSCCYLIVWFASWYLVSHDVPCRSPTFHYSYCQDPAGSDLCDLHVQGFGGFWVSVAQWSKWTSRGFG